MIITNDNEVALIFYQADKMKTEDFWKQINFLKNNAPSWLKIMPISRVIERLDLISKSQGVVKFKV